MKSKELILRKGQLQEQKRNILHEINEMVADMERRDLERFIKSGDPSQVDGKQLRLLQRKRQHLINLEGSLNLEITKLRKQERTKKLERLNKKIKELEEKRKGTLYSRYLHFQSKIKALQEEDKKLKEEATTVRSQTYEYSREVLEIHFRLPELEKVLKQHYIQRPEELEKMVAKAYEQNKKSLRPGPQDVVTKLVRGYSLTLDRDSGKVEKIEPLTCGVDLARSNKIVMNEVIEK